MNVFTFFTAVLSIYNFTSDWSLSFKGQYFIL